MKLGMKKRFLVGRRKYICSEQCESTNIVYIMQDERVKITWSFIFYGRLQCNCLNKINKDERFSVRYIHSDAKQNERKNGLY
jgi:hypothetical protein